MGKHALPEPALGFYFYKIPANAVDFSKFVLIPCYKELS
jgi:hypothetical protein